MITTDKLSRFFQEKINFGGIKLNLGGIKSNFFAQNKYGMKNWSIFLIGIFSIFFHFFLHWPNQSAAKQTLAHIFRLKQQKRNKHNKCDGSAAQNITATLSELACFSPPLTAGILVVDVDSLQLVLVVARVGARGVDSVLAVNGLPKLDGKRVGKEWEKSGKRVGKKARREE